MAGPDWLRRTGGGAPTDVHERLSWQGSFPRHSPEAGVRWSDYLPLFRTQPPQKAGPSSPPDVSPHNAGPEREHHARAVPTAGMQWWGAGIERQRAALRHEEHRSPALLLRDRSSTLTAARRVAAP
jgi:hypothetical protein